MTKGVYVQKKVAIPYWELQPFFHICVCLLLLNHVYASLEESIE